MFRKDVALQNGSLFSLINRLLIGPVVSCITAGVLYSGFFRADKHLSLGSMNAQTFAPLLIFGFLIHNFLNCGYYFFFARMAAEWNRRTLPLLWIAPASRLILALGMASVDATRCLVMSLVGLWIISLALPLSVGAVVAELVLFFGVFALGLMLGFIKSILYFAIGHRADTIDNLYLGLVFTGCLYIPVELLPNWLKQICYLNPIFHAFQAMRLTWEQHQFLSFHVLFLIGSLLVTGAVCATLSHIFSAAVEEKSFA